MRKRQGPGLLVYGGVAYNCTSSADEVSARGRDLLMSGATNVAFTDTRTITTDPFVFQEGGACLYAGQSYIIASVPAPQVRFGSPVSQRLIISLAPAPDSAGDETPAEAAAATTGEAPVAGTRRQYAPLPSTL